MTITPNVKIGCKTLCCRLLSAVCRLLLAVCCLLLLAGSVQAAAVTNWNVLTGNWEDPANWTMGRPTDGDEAYIDNDGTATVESGIMGQAVFLRVGDNGNGTLEILNGGEVTTESHIRIGYSVGSEGKVTVEGSGSELNAGDILDPTSFNVLTVGFSGTGTLEIKDGGRATASSHIYLGDQSVFKFHSGPPKTAMSHTMGEIEKLRPTKR